MYIKYNKFETASGWLSCLNLYDEEAIVTHQSGLEWND